MSIQEPISKLTLSLYLTFFFLFFVSSRYPTSTNVLLEPSLTVQCELKRPGSSERRHWMRTTIDLTTIRSLGQRFHKRRHHSMCKFHVGPIAPK